MAWPYARPRVLFSKCLEGERCRYDGDRVHDVFVGRLRAHVEAVDLCPEVAIGLGVPRPPIRLVRGEGLRLVQPSTGRELTEAMTSYTAQTLHDVGPLDGAVLKSRSPSCGLGDTKIYDTVEADDPIDRGHGLFARGVSAALSGLAITDEARLADSAHRGAFLARLFTLSLLRDTTAPTPDLVSHLRHLLADDEAYHRVTLEVALARTETTSLREAIADALQRGPRRASGAPTLYPEALDSP